MMVNTENSPLMDVFKAFDTKQRPARRRPSAAGSPKNSGDKGHE